MYNISILSNESDCIKKLNEREKIIKILNQLYPFQKKSFMKPHTNENVINSP